MERPDTGELFEHAIETAGVGIGIYGPDGVYVYVNERYAELLATERESLVETPIWEIDQTIDKSGFEQYWEQLDRGATQTVETVHEYGERTVPVELTTTRIETDSTPYNVVTVRDITHQKTRERQLGELHDVTAELMGAASQTEIARLAVSAAETILGYPSIVVRLCGTDDELEPVAVSTQAHSEMGDRPNYPIDGENPASQAYRSGESLIVDDTRKLDDEYDRGESRSVMYLPIGKYGVMSVTDRDAGNFSQRDVDLASILTTDIETALDRLHNEQSLERQNQRLEVFVDVISHDIPNHLNMAGTRLELARQTGELDHLDSVETAHDRIQTVIEDMQTLVEQGKQIEETEWVRLPDIVNRCWEGCRPEDAEGTLVAPDGGHLRADRSRLKQLFENLFWNAVEHAGPDAEIRVGFLDDGFYVEDDGPGIPDSDREDVLTPGYTTAENDHSGFGLAIVNEIARAHGWEMAVTEGTDGGARFEITGVQTSR